MESIAEQIERHKQGMKRIRNTIPLILFVVIANMHFMKFSETPRESRNSWIMFGAMFVYCSTFIVSYIWHMRKLKKLEAGL